ncbi:hypothetical protein HPB47_019816 [Ixodes persulcatus]|uniref:Uncharacterized protein n=1 Tax=Ixodes persulcatus TaxID=34615 RepID=A0AC60QH63_IXOPE|nr:hypothetical protein HPB47_019816 [Ixodes persulcatus]
MEDRELRSVQLKRSESFGFGISVFGGSGLGLPPVIYDVADNSPAASSGQLLLQKPPARVAPGPTFLAFSMMLV